MTATMAHAAMRSGAIADDGPEISVVIPCFNEVENVRGICAAVTVELERHCASHEIVLIDNASTDGTQALMRDLCAEDHRIRAIFNNRNYGQMRSPTYGIYQAEGAAVIGMCADFQDPPALISAMIHQWRAGAQVVLGQRRSEPASAALTAIRSLGYAFLRKFGDYPVIPGATGFGLFSREAVDTLAAWNEPEPFFRGMVIEGGFRLAVVPFDRPPRAAGETKNDLRTLMSFALSGLAGSAKSMLRLPILLSVFAAGIALALLLATLSAMIFSGPVWPLLGLSVAFGMFAMLLLILGMIGDQVRIISERTRNIPLVTEDERVNFPNGRERPATRTIIRSVETPRR